MIRPDMQELLVVGLRSILFNKYKTFPEAYSVVYNVANSMKSKEEDLTFSTLGAMPQKQEGVGINYDDHVSP